MTNIFIIVKGSAVAHFGLILRDIFDHQEFGTLLTSEAITYQKREGNRSGVLAQYKVHGQSRNAEDPRARVFHMLDRHHHVDLKNE